MAATGTAAVADDTGLEVDALGGAPGVYSARYAGEDATYADNVAKLLRELAALDDGGGQRRARFRTVALVAFPDGVRGVGRGRWRGRSPPRRGGATASATTPCSCPTAETGGPSPRCGPRRRTRCRIAGAPSGRWRVRLAERSGPG